MDAVRAAHAQRLLELEGAALARLAQLLDVLKNDVDRLRDLVAERRIAQVGRRHAVVHPAAGRLLALRHVGIDVLGHVRGERDDVVVRHLLDLVDALHGEVGMRADPRGLLLRDAGLAQLGLRLAGQHFDFLPDVELVFQLPDGAHRGARVTVDHAGPFHPVLPDGNQHTANGRQRGVFHGKRRAARAAGCAGAKRPLGRFATGRISLPEARWHKMTAMHDFASLFPGTRCVSPGDEFLAKQKIVHSGHFVPDVRSARFRARLVA